MRLLYLHQYFTTPEFYGGVRSYHFSKRLVERGHQVDLVTSTAFFPVKKSGWFQFVTKHQVEGINVHVVHVPYGNKMSFIRRIISFLLFMLISSLYILKLNKCGLVFASSTPLTIGVPALVAKYVHRIPMVFEVRDLWPDVPIAMGVIKNSFLIKFLRWFESLLYRQSKKIVALSVGMEHELLKKSVEQNKIVVIPNACDLQDFESTGGEVMAVSQLRVRSDTKVCLYAGTFGVVNDLTYLIDLACEIRRKGYDIRFLLIGEGAEKDKIRGYVKDNNLEAYLVLMDPVSKNDLVSYINSVDACFSTVEDIPALFNNSANKFFDALAAGKPIIINHGGWQKEVIEKNNLGLVLNRDCESSTERLNSFLWQFNAEVERRRILTFAKENYSRNILFDKLLREVIDPLQ